MNKKINSPLEHHQLITEKYGKHFCAAPWNSLHEGPNGLVSTCCKTREPIGWSHKQSFEEMYNSDHAKNVRSQFLRGEKPSQCIECWQQEESGYPSSNRITSNNYGRKTIDELVEATSPDGTLSMHKPEWLDLLWTNKCNFACLGCSPDLSSTIHTKYKNDFAILNGKNPENYGSNTVLWNNKNKNKIDYIINHSDTIKYIHLNGGEPFMQEDIYELLEEMLKRNLHKKIVIWTHTNGSITKSYKGVDIINDYLVHWGDMARVVMSNDGNGERGEYIRYGYKDAKWLETFNKIKETKINLKIQTCYNVFNALVIDDIGEWFYDTCGPTQMGSLTLWLNDTINVRMLNLLPELKEIAINKLEKILKNKKHPLKWSDSIPGNIAWLKKDVEILDWQIKAFYNGIVGLDISRKTDFLKTFPELESFYNTAKLIST